MGYVNDDSSLSDEFHNFHGLFIGDLIEERTIFIICGTSQRQWRVIFWILDALIEQFPTRKYKLVPKGKLVKNCFIFGLKIDFVVNFY